MSWQEGIIEKDCLPPGSKREREREREREARDKLYPPTRSHFLVSHSAMKCICEVSFFMIQ